MLQDRIKMYTSQHQQAVNEWEKYEDSVDNRIYYVNRITGESQWNAPIGYNWTNNDIMRLARSNNKLLSAHTSESVTRSSEDLKANTSYKKFIEERQKEREDIAFIEERKRLKESIMKLEKQSVVSGVYSIIYS